MKHVEEGWVTMVLMVVGESNGGARRKETAGNDSSVEPRYPGSFDTETHFKITFESSDIDALSS
jgi:hypothetical protein